MTRIYWLEQSLSEMATDKEWLTDEETSCAESLRFPKRRADWLLGRWTAKRAVACLLNLPEDSLSLACIRLQAGPDGAPVVMIDNKPAAVSVSLSHRAGSALCGLAQPGSPLGCDLESVEPHSESFVRDFFTGQEQELVESARERCKVTTVLWSAKESVLKLLHAGLRLDTKCVSIRPFELDGSVDCWHPFLAEYINGSMFRGWWQQDGGLVRTLVAFPPPSDPVRLKPERVDTAGAHNLPFGKINARAATWSHCP
jgi:4'-phosphopantetheinyl transferase